MLNYAKYFSIFTLCILGAYVFTQDAKTSLSPESKKQLKYKTYFGSCPSRSAGTLTLKLVDTFEKSKSLRDVKLKIVKEKLNEKHFISDYKISYNPIKKKLNFSFDCPKPLMKVQIYKENGLDSYEAILVDNGQLYDPTYEVLLRSEKKLDSALPFLAIPVGDMDESIQKEITHIVSKMGDKFRKKISEVILNENGDLTVILSLRGSPSSVFLGKNEWNNKVTKLKKIVSYMEKRRKIPVIINLTNSKKVVVKFNDKF